MAKKITRVWVETIVDENPDTSHIGELTDDAHQEGLILRVGPYAGSFVDDLEDEDIPHRSREFRFFKPYAGGLEIDDPHYREYALQDYEQMEELIRGYWWFVGVVAKAQFVSSHGTMHIISTAGLWGVESNADDHIEEIGRDELSELRRELIDLGFTEDAVDEAIEEADFE